MACITRDNFAFFSSQLMQTLNQTVVIALWHPWILNAQKGVVQQLLLPLQTLDMTLGAVQGQLPLPLPLPLPQPEPLLQMTLEVNFPPSPPILFIVSCQSSLGVLPL